MTPTLLERQGLQGWQGIGLQPEALADGNKWNTLNQYQKATPSLAEIYKAGTNLDSGKYLSQMRCYEN